MFFERDPLARATHRFWGLVHVLFTGEYLAQLDDLQVLQLYLAQVIIFVTQRSTDAPSFPQRPFRAITAKDEALEQLGKLEEEVRSLTQQLNSGSISPHEAGAQTIQLHHQIRHVITDLRL